MEVAGRAVLLKDGGTLGGRALRDTLFGCFGSINQLPSEISQTGCSQQTKKIQGQDDLGEVLTQQSEYYGKNQENQKYTGKY